MGYANTGFVHLDAATSRLRELRDEHVARGLTTDPPTQFDDFDARGASGLIRELA